MVQNYPVSRVVFLGWRFMESQLTANLGSDLTPYPLSSIPKRLRKPNDSHTAGLEHMGQFNRPLWTR